MVGTKPLDKLTLPRAGAAHGPMLMAWPWVVTLVPSSHHSPEKGPALGDRLLYPVLHFQNQAQNGILGRETKLTKPHQNDIRTRNLLSTQCLWEKRVS